MSKCSIALVICTALFCILDDIGKFSNTFSTKSSVLAHWWIYDVHDVVPSDHACNGFP